MNFSEKIYAWSIQYALYYYWVSTQNNRAKTPITEMLLLLKPYKCHITNLHGKAAQPGL